MKIIGHRGAKGLAAENTIASLQAGIDHHASALEFDIRITKDGVPVLAHDETIPLPDGSTLNVHDHNYADIIERRPDICTLQQALRFINRRAQAIIEVKPGEDPATVILAVTELLSEGWEPDDFAFISFDFKLLQTLHAAMPEITIIVNEMWSSLRATSRAKRLHTKHIDLFSWWLWPGVIRNLQGRGYELYTFPLNDVAKAARWQKYGLAGVVTDFPDRFKK